MEPKILVADDSAMVRHLIKKFLDGEGYEIVTTSDSAKRESLPVIMMSTKKRETMEDLFVSYGISGYLQKPFEKEQLVAMIKKALE
jgi:DNA-binding response OmpR family regulator